MKYAICFPIVIVITLCALTSNSLADTVLAWGYNSNSQCTIPASAASGVSAIAGGGNHTMALKDGAVLAWGYNYYGQCLGTDSSGNAINSTADGAFVQIGGVTLSGVSAIAGGSNHTIALKGGAVLAWGYNYHDQCTIPAAAQSGVTAIAGGDHHTIALQDGSVLAWGRNYEGQCTVPASANSGVSAIASGGNHTIALKDGAVLAWGANYYGQCLGTDSFGNAINSTTDGAFVQIDGVTLSGVTAIAGGEYHTMALKNGAVLVWGYNGDGVCNIPSEATSGVTAIAGGEYHTIALKGGSVLAWGYNYFGQCDIPASANSGITAIGAGANHTLAVGVAIIDPCDVDGNGTPNANEPGPSTAQWLYPSPTITSTFENSTNWSAGIPGYNTDATITGNPQITFDCDNAVKTLELSTNSSEQIPGLSLNLDDHSLTVHRGQMQFYPGPGLYALPKCPSCMPYSVNINDGFIYTAPTGDFPLRFESDHATWNINGTQLYSNSTELATIGSSQIDVKLNNSILNTAAISKGDATGGSRHIELLNSSISDFQGGLTFGDGISLSLGSIMAGDNDYAQNSITAYGGAVFQSGSWLDAWGNLTFNGSVAFGGQLDLHTFANPYHGRSKITVQGESFNYGAGTSSSAFAFMNMFGNNFNDSTCSTSCDDPGLIMLQLDGLASIGGPLFISSTDGSIPAEGNIYTLISLNPQYNGSFDPNNHKFSAVRWLGQNGEGLQNGLIFEQILSSNKLQVQCVRVPIVEPAPANTTDLAVVPFASSSADFNDDGSDDMVNLIVGDNNSVQIMKDMGDGTFALLSTFELPQNETPNAIAAGNVTGDSNPEIAITSISDDVGFVTLYDANGDELWRLQIAEGELPTCVCVLPPRPQFPLSGKVAFGTKITGSGLNFSLPKTGNLNTVSGSPGSQTTTTPLIGVPRTVHSSDIDHDDLSDVTAAGSTSAESFTHEPSPPGFITVVKITQTADVPQPDQFLDFVPIALVTADIDDDGVQDIFASCNSIPSNIPGSTRPVACFLKGSISPTSPVFTMSQPIGISVGRPVQGKAITLIKRNGGFSLAVASTDDVNDSVDVIELTFAPSGGLSIGNQTQISTSGSVIGLRTLEDQGTQKFVTVRKLTEFTPHAVIESTGYVELVYGDFDGSGFIDSGDIAYMLLWYSDAGITDLNGSGSTDSGDLALLLLLMS
ncbi:MAG: hypothetical protein EXS12_01840 [Phycisphaerales bacterium]|nr:hypothetical protein [Phycisphaerales bacterium]